MLGLVVLPACDGSERGVWHIQALPQPILSAEDGQRPLNAADAVLSLSIEPKLLVRDAESARDLAQCKIGVTVRIPHSLPAQGVEDFL